MGTGEYVRDYPCPVCSALLDLDETNCFICGYALPQRDDEEGLEEIMNERKE